jgi:hypothetical protein
VTAERGDSMWSSFGHVALRVTDPTGDAGLVYNFAYAKFTGLDFMVDYLRGTVRFELDVRPWRDVLRRYRKWNRTLSVRELNLSDEQARDLIERLRANALPENRTYVYEHQLDNCSTRVRDALNEATGGALKRADLPDEEITYRPRTLDALSGRWTTLVGIDLIAGPNQEQRIDPWARMYDPLYLDRALPLVTVDDGAATRPLAGPPEVVYRRQGDPPTQRPIHSGRHLALGLGALFGIGLVVATSRRAKRESSRIAGLLLLVVATLFGAIGSLLWALVGVSNVVDYAWTENALLFLPFDLVWLGQAVRWLRGRPGVSRLVRVYSNLRLGAGVLYALAKAVGLFPQDNWAFMVAVLVTLLGLRAAMRVHGRG